MRLGLLGGRTALLRPGLGPVDEAEHREHDEELQRRVPPQAPAQQRAPRLDPVEPLLDQPQLAGREAEAAHRALGPRAEHRRVVETAPERALHLLHAEGLAEHPEPVDHEARHLTTAPASAPREVSFGSNA